MEFDFRAFLAEALGTFILVLSIGMSAGQPIAVGGALWLGMCITGFRSGAQFNPAVTLSLISKSIMEGKAELNPTITLLLNIPFQLAAGLLAGLTAWGVGIETFYFDVDSHSKTYKGFFCEMFFTMLLCMNVHKAGIARNGLFLEGGVIALTLTTCAYTIGHVTRNGVNPAVEIGLNVANYAHHHDHIRITWLYVVAPICGGILAASFTAIRAFAQKKQRFSKTLNFELLVKS